MEEAQFEQGKLLEYLRQKWGEERPCQMCGHKEWAAADKVFELRAFKGGILMVGGPVTPVIPIACTNCGNTVLVNAIVAGLLKKAEESTGTETPGKTTLTGRRRQS